MADPIIWRNPANSVLLLDVPQSIASAQGIDDFPCKDRLLSSPPQLIPYRSNEPKSASAKAKLTNNTISEELHGQYQRLLQQALDDISESHIGVWCLPRVVPVPAVAEGNPVPGKRRRLNEDEAPKSTPVEEFETGQPSSLGQRSVMAHSHAHDQEPFEGRSSDLTPPNDTKDGECNAEPFFHNSTAVQIILESKLLKVGSGSEPRKFRIPPNASFFLGDCVESRHFHTTIRSQAQTYDTPRHFDFVLLDPPWPNRSVRRSRKTPGSSYTTATTLQDLQRLLLNMDLDMLMADECLFGMWITNKPALRDMVLGDGGFFDIWGVQLVEEWIWLKTTANGEPVTPLDSLWRKPYEILLLGRKRSHSANAYQGSTDCDRITRRVLVSVPDLHSRKPCLKQLIEPMMPHRYKYRALEVFARHLVAGWWSYGDECIKFNWDGFWRSSDSQSEDMGDEKRGT